MDDIAERIRALGLSAPGTHKAFTELSRINAIDGVPSADEIVEVLIRGYEQVVNICREDMVKAQEAHDESSVALISDRIRIHEQTAWMLRALQ